MINLLLYAPLFLALYAITTFFIHKLKNLPPTPFLCFPLIGHIYLLKKPLHRTLAVLSDNYGSAFYLRLGFRSVLIISSQAAAKDCRLSRNDLFPDNPKKLANKFIGYINAKLLSALPFGQQWQTLRRILMSDLIYCGCLELFSTLRREEMKSVIKRLHKQSYDEKGNIRNGQVTEMTRVFYELTYRIIIRLIAGEEWCNGEKGEKFGKVLEEMVKVAKSTNVITNFVPFLSKFRCEGNLRKMFVRVHGDIDRILQDLIDDQRSIMMIGEEYEEGSRRTNQKTMIQVMLALQQKHPVLYSDDIIKDLVLVLLIVGTDTCSTTLEWALSLLLNNPRVLYKAQAEIDMKIGHDHLINEPDRLPYLECIIKETLRMYPAGPLLVPHELPKGCRLEGRYSIPPGTLVLLNMWAIHNDPKYWDEPQKFKPERFEDGIGENKIGYKFMDFGPGSSQFSSEILAIRMVGIILGSIIQCFDLEKNGEEMVDMKEGALLTMTKDTPLEARLRARTSMLDLINRI